SGRYARGRTAAEPGRPARPKATSAAVVSWLCTQLRLQARFAGEAKARDHHDLVGTAAHGLVEAAELQTAHDRLCARIERPVARGLYHLGVEHLPRVVDGDGHGQLAVELATAGFRKVRGAPVLDLAAQGVVVDRIDLLAGGRTDVALARTLILFVDALF